MFAAEVEVEEVALPWKVLIVDDDEGVHAITKSVLKKQIIDGRGIEFHSAFNGAQAIEVLSEIDDIAVIFLDVVMETNEAGLDACRRIREELNNDLVRIILRTGQPGSAPENEVIVRYRINDYKEKTELTASKLFSCMVTAIRSYQDLINLEQSKQGLRKVIEATKSITKKKSIGMFLEGILDQLVFILDASESSITTEHSSCYTIACEPNNRFSILSSMTDKKLTNKKNIEDLPVAVQSIITDCHQEEANIMRDNLYAGYFRFGKDQGYIFCLSGSHELHEIDKNLLNIFSGNINIALDNLFLNEEIINTQQELIEKLGEVVEKRSSEASEHVKRVSKFSYLLALDAGLSDLDATMLSSASPMHDIGKVGIPDAILLKPDKLTEEEFEIMKTHAKIGYEIFKSSERTLLKAAALIAIDHHEKWNGSGYPNGKSGEDIHIYGRITAVADVFDALYHNRCYKPAWPIEDIVALFEDQKGIHFDPQLVDIVLGNLDKYTNVVINK
jgi:response regulator RpfG family c-di-GMP phosphodiesterase